jgi:hypothetical protein
MAATEPQLDGTIVHGVGNIDFIAKLDPAPARQLALEPPIVKAPQQNDKYEEETQRQACFENAIKKELKIPNSYVQVAPLIIRWDPEIDDHYAGHTAEVS